MDTAEEISRIFGETGPLSKVIPDYRMRQSQVDFAKAVGNAIASKDILVSEAGTGTGKTYAYLVPAFLFGKKTIISTGTKTLQDQLFEKDIKEVRKALAIPITVAKLKGRANYLCHYQIEKTAKERTFSKLRDVEVFREYERLLEVSDTGDISEVVSTEGEYSDVTSRVTSTRENCLGADCPHIAKCFVLKARKRALEAEVVVVNHHLLFADLVLKEDGFGELLPDCDVVILDEAHQVPDVATNFFGESVSSNQIFDFIRDLRYAISLIGTEVPETNILEALEKAMLDARLSLVGRYNVGDAIKNVSIDESALPDLGELISILSKLKDRFQDYWSESVEMQNCAERLLGFNSFFSALKEQSTGEHICWIELNQRYLKLNISPLNVSSKLKKYFQIKKRAWIFTSATLSVGENFSFFTDQIGAEDVSLFSCESPFDYESNSILYVPTGMPLPADKTFVSTMVEKAFPLIEASNGRCFMLFTSLSAMREAQTLVKAAIEKSEVEFSLLVQGDTSKYELLKKFKNEPNAILLGSYSFWEGVDVRGDGLVLVLIDKLPFAVPDDPIVAGKITSMKRLGLNPFMNYQVPEATLALKQGAGRLIRDESDRGVLVIFDPRLIEKPYGKVMWKSLPKMKRTQDLSEVTRFLSRI